MDEIMRQRKFTLACFFSLMGTIGWFLDKLTGSEYITLVTIILGLYATANVLQRQVEKGVVD